MFYKNQIYNYPVNTTEWRDMKMSMENGVKHKKEFSREILCFDSLFFKFNQKISNIYQNGFVSKDECDLFSEDRRFDDNQDIKFVKRYEAEYNPRFIQLSVALVLEDMYNNVLLLKGRDGKLSFIKGHVDKYDYVYNMSELDYLKENMLRELHEEIKIPHYSDKNVKHLGYMYLGNTECGREHIYSLYKLELDSLMIKKIKSNEPYKHDTAVFSKKSLYDFGYDLDDWCTLYFKTLKL